MKRKMLTKMMSVTLAAMMAAGVIAGCGSDTGNPDSTTEAQADTGDKIVLPFWLKPMEEASQKFWDESVAAFNESNPDNIYVDLQYIPEDAYDSKLKAAQANGTAPQIIYVGHAGAIMDGMQGLLKPLNDYIDESLLDDLLPNVREMITTDSGDIYSIPMYVEPYSLLFYRKDLFEQAGLDPENPPKTYDELIADAEKLTTDTTFGLGIAGSADAGWVYWGDMATLGLNYINDDWSEATVNNQISKDFINLQKSYYDKKIVPEQPLSSFWDIQPLAEGRLAMQFNGSWAISRLMVDMKDVVDPENIGIALTPTFEGIKDGDPVGALGGWGLGIDGKAKNPEAVAEFIQYILYDNPEKFADFFSNNYYAKFTVSKQVTDILNERTDDKKIDEWYDFIADKVIPYSKAEPVFPWEINQKFVDAVDNVIVNGMSVDDALAECENEINECIETNELAGTNPKK